MTDQIPVERARRVTRMQLFVRWVARRLFGSGGLLRSGLSFRTLCWSVGCTMLLAFVVNSLLVREVRSTYETARLAEVNGSADAADAVERLTRAGMLDPKLQPWAKEQLSDRPGRRPAREQILALFDGVASTTAEGREKRAAALEQAVTGNQSGFVSRFFWVSNTQTSGSELFEQLADADGKPWRRALERGELADEKKKFITAYLNSFLTRTQPPLRELDRYNGPVKWLATVAAFMLLWAVAGRAYLLARVEAYWLRSTLAARRTWKARLWFGLLGLVPPPPTEEHAELLAVRAHLRAYHGPDPSAVIRERMKDLRHSAESGVYGTLSYGVGLLPSLGFIGTVWGLGGALLQANGLFSVADRQKTIGHITHELGIAFDTTLIALVGSVITGVCIAALRLRERRLFDLIEAEFEWEAHQQPGPQPSANGTQPSANGTQPSANGRADGDHAHLAGGVAG